MTGIFITFEGGDGVGKTTQSRLLAEWLEAQGREVVLTREPGGTPLGVEVRQVLLHGGDEIGAVDSRAEALLYAADRAQNIAKIVRPALARGAVVVQDRFIDSSLAYQGVGRVLEVDDVRRINEWAADGLWPNLTVLLDLDPEAGANRVESRERGFDRLEAAGEEFHASVRQAFRGLAEAEPERFIIVDAAQSIDTIQAEIRARVSDLVSASARLKGRAPL